MKLHYLLALLFIISSCQKYDDLSQFKSIKYGIGGGECAGYCEQNITLTKGASESYHNYYNSPGIMENEDKTCIEPYYNWATLIKKIDFGDFRKIDERIGCPGCADGGVIWVEITYGSETHKVEFESPDQPDAVNDYIDDLEAQLYLMIGLCL